MESKGSNSDNADIGTNVVKKISIVGTIVYCVNRTQIKWPVVSYPRISNGINEDILLNSTPQYLTVRNKDSDLSSGAKIWTKHIVKQALETLSYI